MGKSSSQFSRQRDLGSDLGSVTLDVTFPNVFSHLQDGDAKTRVEVRMKDGHVLSMCLAQSK